MAVSCLVAETLDKSRARQLAIPALQTHGHGVPASPPRLLPAAEAAKTAAIDASPQASSMASPALSRRVGTVVRYPPLVDMDDRQRREFHEALLDADSFDDLPGKWQAAILEAEGNRPKLWQVSEG